MSIPSVEISGLIPEIRFAISLPEPADIVHPRVPWPVLRNKLAKGVVPIIGGPSGVLGRKPVQN